MALADYLELDDGVISGAMHAWEQGPDRALGDLAARMRARALFKTLELFGEQATAAGRAQAFEVAKDIASRAGLDPTLYVGLDVATDAPFGEDAPDGEHAEPLMVVFAKGPPRPLADVSFLLARLAGQVLSRVRLIFAPELREKITHALAA